MRVLLRGLIVLLAFAALAGAPSGARGGALAGETWSVTQDGTILEIAYGSGSDFPQYAALHLESSYLRLNLGPGSIWGTSVVLFPPFWSGSVYYQGAPIKATWQTSETELVISISGTNAGLHVEGSVTFSPPVGQLLPAMVVELAASGNVSLDKRPGEAFKPAMLSSMHIGPDMWDAETAYAGSELLGLSSPGWVVQPPSKGSVFGLNGGSSAWNSAAPTIEVTLDRELPITGWVTASVDPNDDNVGFWAASDTVLPSWSYLIAASAKSSPADTDGDTLPNGGDHDDDNDGCADLLELGSSPQAGGRRDPHNFWDVFDVPATAGLVRDGDISGQDIFAVLARFNATDEGPGDFDRSSDPLSTPNSYAAGAYRANYHPAYDRGPVVGPNAWNLGPADGAVTGGDIFAVLAQFGHSCAA